MSDVWLTTTLSKTGVLAEQLKSLEHKGKLDKLAQIILAELDTKPAWRKNEERRNPLELEKKQLSIISSIMKDTFKTTREAIEHYLFH